METDHFISCDWGTSSLRLKLVDRASSVVLASAASAQGIQPTFEEWRRSGCPPRAAFYQGVLKKGIDALSKQCRRTLRGCAVLLSGMASSSIGMKELPYAALPLPLNGSGLVVEEIPAGDYFPHPTLLISGASKSGDVMRGEEVQAIGWAQTHQPLPDGCVLILPGTHSKHLYIENGQIVDFKTFMTGELFQVLRTHSILKNSIVAGKEWNADAQHAFTKGVEAVRRGNLTNLLFSIRAKRLEGSLNATEAGHYLSGLLIGHEFKERPRQHIILGGEATFSPRYQLAMEKLGFEGQVTAVEPGEVTQWSLEGHLAIERLWSAASSTK